MDNKIALVRKANTLLKDSLKRCMLCPRKCGIDRESGRTGYCRAPAQSVVYSYNAHFGEEPPLSGSRGSGTIFFSHCTMKCVYCQNYTFSQLDGGCAASVERLADIMIALQETGCHNINLVSPTHFVPQILRALGTALEKGLIIPIVYNTSGYELVETIRLLEGIVDIYLPDMRYADNALAKKYSDAPDYVERDREAVIEMQRQAGDLVLDENGIARKGIIIRLLAIPNAISGTIATLRFIKERISAKAHISVMSQYHPTFKASGYRELARGVSPEEYKNIVDEASLLGLNDGWIQEMPDESDTSFLGTNIKPRRDIT